MYAYNIFKAVIIIGFSYVIYLKTSKWTAYFFRKFITGMAYVIIFSAFMWKLSACVSEPFKSIWIVLFSSGFLMAATKEVLSNVITNMIISYAASHMLFLLTSVVAVVITVIFYWIRNGYIDNALFQGIMDVVVWRITLLAFIMEVMIAMVFMRFKISISESQKRLASSVGVSISGIIVIFYSLSRQETLSNSGWALLMSGIALCAAGLLCCFKKDTIVAYNDKVKELIVERLKIKLKDTQNANDFLENVTHRDSKRLPAYRRAVEEFMKSMPDGEGKSKAEELLRELKTAEQE